MIRSQVEKLAGNVKPNPDEDEATMTAQYVRLSLFVLVVLLGLAIAWATFVEPEGEWEGSISDYFHTPARPALVGTMVAVGIGLMVLYSSNRWENRLLNVAGAFAPIVGLAATTQASGSTPTTFDVPSAHVDALARTTLPAYFAALMLLGGVVYFVHPASTRGQSFRSAVTWIVVLAALVLVVWIVDRRKVHVLAAFGFFVPLIILVIATACTAVSKYRKRYALIAGLMIAAGLWYGFDRWKLESAHATFFVEAVLIVCFALFWLSEYRRIAPRTQQVLGSGDARVHR